MNEVFDHQKINTQLDLIQEELNHLDDRNIWRPVKHFEKTHLVSTHGQVYSLIGKKVLSPRLLNGGKWYVTLNANGLRLTKSVQIIRDTAFIPPSPKVRLLSGKRVSSIILPELEPEKRKSGAVVVGKGLVTLTIKKKTGEQ